MTARKSFSERSPLLVGAVGVIAVLVTVLIAIENQKLPFIHQKTSYSAYFSDAGGLFTGAIVQVSGFPVGKVTDIALDDTGAKVTFDVANNIHLGDRTEAAIRTKGLLGTKELDVTPAGDGQLRGTIPVERTVSPYQLPAALGDLSATISGINTDQLSDSLATLAKTFSDTPPEVKSAVQGVARFAQTLDARDAHLRSLLDNANKAATVLAKRTDKIVALVRDTNALLAQLRTQSAALDQIAGSISAAAHQLEGFITDNRQQLKPALDKLNGVLQIVDNRKERLQQSIKMLNVYAMGLGETISSGPFFKAYVVNLLPGQFIQPFVDAAFSDLGLDPATKTPAQLTDPQTGQPGTPPLPMPYPRTGQGGEPRRTLPDAITGNPQDHQCGPVPLPGPGCYPYRQPPPAPPPGGPPPGPPAPPPADQHAAPGPLPVPTVIDVGPPTPPGGDR
ncbi:MAG: MCE family protein [Actinomycetota bacterium]|uniref:MCE family protein n=1 Tax=Mycobacterium lentiflavum TaxID=141349 RepID=A0ABY3USB6_MYCLN|nr:MCE family protein [Mycobacterium lentiflavum]MEE3062427.1 MCE family protein [Actinomycetota bacterium]ULP40347.1 MCE family protein [Mycobacterium lentiflavum]